MDKEFLVLELAHSSNGRVKRIELSYKTLAYAFAALLLLSVTGFAVCSSYLRMTWKAMQYNELRANFERLRTRYTELQRLSKQHTEQMASLETLASEVTAAYGLQPAVAPVPDEITSSVPSVKESIEEYNFLKGATYSSIYHQYGHVGQTHTRPSLWPVDGVLRSPFGGRTDPFSGEGTFHTGIDLAAVAGTPVHVTADGVVESAGWAGGYGKLVVVDHGNGMETYYAHLSQIRVLSGQEVRRGDIIALSGGTGRSTGPHVHYEVRLRGTPLNPYKFLGTRQPDTQAALNKLSRTDLGL